MPAATSSATRPAEAGPRVHTSLVAGSEGAFIRGAGRSAVPAPAVVRTLPGPLPDVRRHAHVPRGAVEPPGLPAARAVLVVVFVADPGEELRGGPPRVVGLGWHAVSSRDGRSRGDAGREDGHLRDLHARP